jgi:hypothetical protein
MPRFVFTLFGEQERPSPRQRHRAARRSALAATLAAAAIVLAACGSSDNGGGNGGNSGSATTSSGGTQTSTGTGNEPFSPTVVRDTDIQAQPKGSPQQALLEWWQAFQFQDESSVLKLTAPATLHQIPDSKLAKLIQVRGPGLQGIKVLGVSQHGNSASVRVALLTFTPKQKNGQNIFPKSPTSATPQTFVMAKKGSSWLFDSPDYLKLQIANTNL